MLFSENNADILYNEITGAYLDRGYMHGEGLTKDQVNRSRDLFKAMAYDLIDRGDETGRIHTPEILCGKTTSIPAIRNRRTAGCSIATCSFGISCFPIFRDRRMPTRSASSGTTCSS